MTYVGKFAEKCFDNIVENTEKYFLPTLAVWCAGSFIYCAVGGAICAYQAQSSKTTTSPNTRAAHQRIISNATDLEDTLSTAVKQMVENGPNQGCLRFQKSDKGKYNVEYSAK